MADNALIIGIRIHEPLTDIWSESLLELKELTETLGYHVIEILSQNRHEIDPKYYFGKGKIEEIKQFYTSKMEIAILVVNVELSPAQIRNIERELELKVVTRTEVILNIFAIHARTKTARLQVELAQLSYQYSRMVGKRESLSRLGAGIKTRGPGEKKLEVDRRFIRKRIVHIKRQLTQIGLEMQIRRKKRIEKEHKVSIVGYTNTGKSSLLNRLTKSEVFVLDRPFATLDTTSRKLWLGDDTSIVLTDTVGFIREIPHFLIESFKSTLEDIRYSDLLIHLEDASAPEVEDKIETVKQTLFEIGAQEIPIILCFNKIDLVSAERLVELRLRYPEALVVSVLEKTNMDVLKSTVKRFFIGKKNELDT